jgi:hypothetical protein
MPAAIVRRAFRLLVAPLQIFTRSVRWVTGEARRMQSSQDFSLKEM